jgi:hypothetical protein
MGHIWDWKKNRTTMRPAVVFGSTLVIDNTRIEKIRAPAKEITDDAWRQKDTGRCKDHPASYCGCIGYDAIVEGYSTKSGYIECLVEEQAI